MKSFEHCESCKLNKNIPSLNTVEDAGMFFMDWILDQEFQTINKKLFVGKELFATMFVPFEMFHYPKPLQFSFTKKTVKFHDANDEKEESIQKWMQRKTILPMSNHLQKRKKIELTITKSKSKSKSKSIEMLSQCYSTNDCLMFGELQSNVMKYFDFFSSFVYLKNSPNTIGEKNRGANSVVRELVFQRQHITSSILLKTNLSKNKDSIIYEYLAGKEYMNYINMYSPIFIETYDLFVLSASSQFNSAITRGQLHEFVNRLQEPHELSKDLFLNHLSPVDSQMVLNNFLKLCNESVLSLSLQFIKKSKTLLSWLEESSSEIKQHEIVLILFQIYFNLMRMKQTFTHYDLHLKNVLIYEADPNKYYYYQYQMPNRQIISFCSSFVVKIIDYGRCYFDNRLCVYDKREKNKNNTRLTKMNSTTLYNLARRHKECQRLFLFSSSFMKLHKDDFLLSYIFNPSQDLRLLISIILDATLGLKTSIIQDRHLSENCKLLIKRISIIKEKEITKMNSNMIYLPFDYKYGTQPIFQRGYKSIYLPNFIYNPLLSFHKKNAQKTNRSFLQKAIRINKLINLTSNVNTSHKREKKNKKYIHYV